MPQLKHQAGGSGFSLLLLRPGLSCQRPLGTQNGTWVAFVREQENQCPHSICWAPTPQRALPRGSAFRCSSRGEEWAQCRNTATTFSNISSWRRLCHHLIYYTKHTSALIRISTDQSKLGALEGRYHAVAGLHPNHTAPFHPSWMKIRDIARKTFMINSANPKSISPIQCLDQNTPPASKLASSDYQMQKERNCNITVKLTF